ncbi:hypothetical protein DERP_006762 [Dermatophagoides pteronyssinus]|uniref:Uncharacterized protein n=1 Tax=Dermatophagoides pteronyssinus TaxID=6956 RepID=A0ABQ8IRX8_DERPT|nr:hypothetical protein DERP_006762 [Dermatophagoides pteronyssinus]
MVNRQLDKHTKKILNVFLFKACVYIRTIYVCCFSYACESCILQLHGKFTRDSNSSYKNKFFSDESQLEFTDLYNMRNVMCE